MHEYRQIEQGSVGGVYRKWGTQKQDGGGDCPENDLKEQPKDHTINGWGGERLTKTRPGGSKKKLSS